jgi:hypothetical protein
MRSVLPTLVAAFLLAAVAPPATAAGQWTVLGWNDLGMHCMDGDYTVFSILPPFNNVRAQVVDPSGRLVTDPSRVRLSYEALADPDGSINRSSIGKTGFWNTVQPLFGVALAPDVGLAGCTMPGVGNLPQPMAYDATRRWFGGDGVPITPYDDAGHKNAYPLMRLVVRDPAGAKLAEAPVVLPVSDEMDCASCHGSNTVAAARPIAGWVKDPDPARDYRLNILRLHDDRQRGQPAWTAALQRLALRPDGLEATLRDDHRPVLCAACHASNALPGTGISGIAPLTSAMHTKHAAVRNPVNGLTLDASANRSACYSCHPGSTTRCLRGAMGAAVAADGSMEMQCQSCHGNMSKVGDARRVGWLQQPACQNCHSGTASQNSGELRYTSVFDAGGALRSPANATFATTANQPAAGFDLFRFSTGHGGLACEACHGSTHAEYPSSHRNDNLQSQQLQGHAGVLSNCTTCHATPTNGLNGPHGLHPLGAAWVNAHGDIAERNRSACQSCHGSDYRGTVLSASQSDQTLSTKFGSRSYWRGARIGCYSCHDGPGSESATRNHAPVVTDASLTVPYAGSAGIDLGASDADGNPLTLRIVAQPAHGSVALSGRRAVYQAEVGASGDETFSFAASDGNSDSNLGHVQVHVAAATYTIGADTSGAFYDPAQSGEGWFIEVLPDHRVVAGGYFYLDGEQRWLYGTGSAIGNQVRVPLVIGGDGRFPPDYAVATTRIETWGEVVLQFDDRDHGQATWTSGYPGFSAGRMPLTRLTSLASADAGAPPGGLRACHSGSWYNADQSGHGLQVEVLDRTPREMVAIWYTYLDGQQRWLYAQGPISGDTATLDVLVTRGGQFPPNFDPATVVRQPWGTLRFRAIDGDHARIDWNSSLAGYGSGGLDLVRLTALAGHACP